MGEPGRQFRGQDKAFSPNANKSADPGVPGRGTMVTHAPTSLEGLALQQLRIAIGALAQIRAAWLPLLETANLQHQWAGPTAVLDATSALMRADTAMAQAAMLRASVRSADVERTWDVVETERDAVKPRLVAAIQTQAFLSAVPSPQHGQPTGPAQAPGAPTAPKPAPAPAAPTVAAPGKLAPPAPAPTPAPPAKQADDAVNPGPSYAPTWEDIAKAAAGDAAALAKLDVAWIDGLDGYFINSIEGAFTKSQHEAAFQNAAKADKGLAQLDADHKKALKADGGAHTDELQHAHDEARAKAVTDLRTKFDAKKVSHGFTQNVAAPPKDGITSEEARLLARANFVSWGAHALGSVAALKAHFRAMRTVSKIKDKKNPLWLWGPAATRLEAAWDWFEKTYPGNTFFQTDVGFGLRGVHHEAHPLSYLGHALGFSVDFRAYDNPSFLSDGAGMYMLRKFGGHDEKGKHVDGKSRMDMPNDMYKQIQEMGRSSERGEDVPARGQEILDAATSAYDAMTATSDNFRAAMAKNMDDLRAAKASWIKINGPLKGELATAEQKLKAAQTAAGAKVAKGTVGADRQAAIDGDEGVVAATKARDEVAAKIATEKKAVDDTVSKVFKPWVDQLEGEVAATTKGHEADLALAIDLDGAKALKGQVAAAKTVKALHAVLDSKPGKLVFDGEKLKSITDLAELKAAMTRRAAEVHDAKYAAAENGVRGTVIKRLKDPGAVFGSVAYNARSRTWNTAMKADAPPVMQILELGFARHDEMAGPERVKDPKQVFNREFITTMMRFGWNTGADWGAIDTMHFDFLDGYSAVSSGGFFTKGKFGPKE